MQLSVASGQGEELPRLWAVKFHKICLINLQKPQCKFCVTVDISCSSAGAGGRGGGNAFHAQQTG